MAAPEPLVGAGDDGAIDRRGPCMAIPFGSSRLRLHRLARRWRVMPARAVAGQSTAARNSSGRCTRGGASSADEHRPPERANSGHSVAITATSAPASASRRDCRTAQHGVAARRAARGPPGRAPARGRPASCSQRHSSTADDRRSVLVPGLYVRPSTATTGCSTPSSSRGRAGRATQSLWASLLRQTPSNSGVADARCCRRSR